jgi:hypothetical protein
MSKIYFSRRCLKLFFAVMLIGICFFIPENAFAKGSPGREKIADPEQIITGIVKDASTGNPLAGATIALKGSSQSATSDVNGAFSITVAMLRRRLMLELMPLLRYHYNPMLLI